jgi:hypothetical protein
MDPRANIKYDQCEVKGNNKRSEGTSINLRHSLHKNVTNFIYVWYRMCNLKLFDIIHFIHYPPFHASVAVLMRSSPFCQFTAQSGTTLPTFRDNLSVPSSRVQFTPRQIPEQPRSHIGNCTFMFTISRNVTPCSLVDRCETFIGNGCPCL